MLTSDGVSIYDSTVGLPIIPPQKWYHLLTRVDYRWQSYADAINQAVANGMPAELPGAWWSKAEIDSPVTSEGTGRVVWEGEVARELWLDPDGEPNENSVQWYDRTIGANYLDVVQQYADGIYPFAPYDWEIFIARVAARTLWQMWTLVGWRQRLQLTGRGVMPR